MCETRNTYRQGINLLHSQSRMKAQDNFFCGRVPWLYRNWPVGLCFLLFYVQEHPKAQPAVVLVLKRLRRRDNGLKSHPTDWEKPRIEPAAPG